MPNKPTVGPAPASVTLGVMTGGETGVPVSRNDVERAIWAFTGWQGGQDMVDELLAVVDAYALEMDQESYRAFAREMTMKRVIAVQDQEQSVDPGQAQGITEWLEALVKRYGGRSLADVVGDLAGSARGQEILELARTAGPQAPDTTLDEDGVMLADGLGNTHGTCTKCRERKPVDEFGRDATRKSGRKSRCRDCLNAGHVARRAARKQQA